MAEDDHDIPLDREQLAEQSVRSAWRDLPTYDRELLENIGAAQSQVTTRHLGRAVHDRAYGLRSFGWSSSTRLITPSRISMTRATK